MLIQPIVCISTHKYKVPLLTLMFPAVIKIFLFVYVYSHGDEASICGDTLHAVLYGQKTWCLERGEESYHETGQRENWGHRVTGGRQLIDWGILLNCVIIAALAPTSAGPTCCWEDWVGRRSADSPQVTHGWRYHSIQVGRCHSGSLWCSGCSPGGETHRLKFICVERTNQQYGRQTIWSVDLRVRRSSASAEMTKSWQHIRFVSKIWFNLFQAFSYFLFFHL